MIKTPPKRTSFFLLDSAMLSDAAQLLPMAKEVRPEWLIPVYKENAVTVSPFVIDIEAAFEAGQLDQIMASVNVLRPRLHVSIIETTLPHVELAQHLRQFICVADEIGKPSTLRFADCAVLPALAAAFNPEQWAMLTGPMTRWSVHQRGGTLIDLPLAKGREEQAALPIPFKLSGKQIHALQEASLPDQLIVNALESRYGKPFPGNPMEQHRWASEAQRMWRAAGHTDNAGLLSLVNAVFEARGTLLSHPGLPAMLEKKDLTAIRLALQETAVHC